jgi:hypothetical protein
LPTALGRKALSYWSRVQRFLRSIVTDRFQRLCEDPNYVKFGEMHSVIVAPLLI